MRACVHACVRGCVHNILQRYIITHIGWLIKLEMRDSSEYDGLMTQSDYMKFIQESS